MVIIITFQSSELAECRIYIKNFLIKMFRYEPTNKEEEAYV